MSKYFCNPMNLPYKYNYQKPNMPGLGDAKLAIYREAADPIMEFFKGKYYLFPSMTAGFFVSEDLIDWEYHKLDKPIPIFDYAPDVRVVGDFLYFCASKRSGICNFYRSRDPINEPFEEINGSFAFWDPNIFCDDDGRIYLYWGCSNITPIWGVELDPTTMKPIGEKQVMFNMDNKNRGYERSGMDHVSGKTPEGIAAATEAIFADLMKMPEENRRNEGLITEDDVRRLARGFAGDDPYIEGAYMTKHNGKYYLQYACPATQVNVYNDGVLISDNPLGPFKYADNNPFSYKPGGFANGAGHGSTVAGSDGKYWHTASISISVNNDMERRLGLWKAGFDKDDDLYCDQMYGDWPINVDAPAFADPDFMLLSYGKNVTVSSGTGKDKITNECIRDWWMADTSNNEWAQVDLGKIMDIRMVQLNFADQDIIDEIPADADRLIAHEIRYIDEKPRATKWILEGSIDGANYEILCDKSKSNIDLANDFIDLQEFKSFRYIKLTVLEVPFNQKIKVSGIRIFGKCDGNAPQPATGVKYDYNDETGMDMMVSWNDDSALGHNIVWGYAKDKLYHSYMVFGKNSQNIAALVKGQSVYARVDSFNEVGITKGEIVKVR